MKISFNSILKIYAPIYQETYSEAVCLFNPGEKKTDLGGLKSKGVLLSGSNQVFKRIPDRRSNN